MNFELVGVIALVIVVAGFIFFLGYSAGESDSHKKILARQQQAESAKRWKEVIDTIQQKGGV